MPAAAQAVAGHKKTSPRKKNAKPPPFDPYKPPPPRVPKTPKPMPEVNEDDLPFWMGLSAMVQIVRPAGVATDATGTGTGADPGTGTEAGAGDDAAAAAALLSSPVAMPSFPNQLAHVGSNRYGGAHNMLSG